MGFGGAQLAQAGEDLAGDEQVAVGVELFPLPAQFGGGLYHWGGMVVGQHQAVSPAGGDELLDDGGAFLPAGRAGGAPAGVAVEAEPDAGVQQAGQVVEVGVVVAVADIDAGEVNAFLFEDANLLLAHAVGRPGVGADAGSGGVAGAGGGAQDDFLVFGDAAPVAGNLDDARLDAGVLNAMLNFLDEQRRHPVHGGAPENARHGQVVAGAGDGVDTGTAADFLHQGDIAAQVKGGDINDGADAAGVGFGQGGAGGIGDGTAVLKAGVGGGGAGGAQGDVFVAQGKAQLGRINRAQDGVDLRHWRFPPTG